MKLDLQIDGGSRGNPGPAATGVVIKSVDPAFTVHEAGYFLGRTTNNVAEYRGLIRALELAIELGAGEVRIFSDSELMVRQITGQYRVKSPDLKPLYHEALRLLLKIDLWHLRHVDREENKRADEMVNMALDAGRDVVVTSGAAFKPPVVKSLGAASSGDSSSPRPLGEVGRTRPGEGSSNADGPDERWIAEFTTTPGTAGGECPARCPANKPFLFGPTTPPGFCIHATQALFEDGPLEWSAAHEDQGEVTCRRCGARIRIKRIK